MITKWNITIPELTGEEPRSAYVYVPDAFKEAPEARYSVLYMFDGHNVFFRRGRHLRQKLGHGRLCTRDPAAGHHRSGGV